MAEVIAIYVNKEALAQAIFIISCCLTVFAIGWMLHRLLNG